MKVGAKRISATLDRLFEEASTLLELAIKAGAEEAEVFGVSGRSVQVDLRRRSIETASESIGRGLGLRAVIGGGVGFASISDPTRLQDAAESAVKAAVVRGADRSWRGLPGQEPCSIPSDIFDPLIRDMSPEGCLGLAGQLLEGCLEVSDVEPQSGVVTCLFGEEVILNSSGLQHVQCGTSVVAAIDTICKGAGIVSTGFEFGNSRKLGLDLSEIGRTAAMLSKNSLHGGSAGTGTGDVLLRPVAFADLLENTFLPAVYADNVQKGRSPLVGKLKESIASAGLSILDDGLLPGGMGSSAVDDEGVPSRRTAVVDGGMLRSFLYDGLSAGKDGLSSTGNAVRSGYADLPRVGARNILIESSAAQDPFEDVKEGVVVGGVIGAHTANPISGDFSVEARNAFHVVDGELAGPIKSAMIAGNIYDLLSGLVVGLDHRAVGSIVVPTVRARMRVVG